MSENEASNDYEQNEMTTKEETVEMYEKTDGGASAHGHFMEIHLLTLFKLQGDKKLGEFYLAGNYRRAGTFDDIVFRYIDDRDKPNIIFLQAKSKAIITNKVGLEIFENGRMFDLQKHFQGFLNIQDEWNKPVNGGPIFRGRAENANCHYVMYTNAIMGENMIQHVDVMDTNPLSIVLGQTSGHACKLKVETATKLFREILNSDEIKNVIRLLKTLSNTNCKNMRRDDIFNVYHAFLTQTVLVKSGMYWRFRNEFLKGGFQNETIKKFREETIKWYTQAKLDNKKSKNTEVSNDEIIAHMRSWEVELPDWMEIQIPKFQTVLCDKFIKTASKCISGNICTIKNMRKDVLNKVAKFAGNVFVFDEKIGMFLFNEEKIDGEPEKFLEYMRSKFNVPHLKFDFQVGKFPRLALGFTKIDSKMQEFIKKLVILTGQPSEGNLKDLIQLVISVNLSTEDANMRCLQMIDKITGWWQQFKSAKYLKKDDKFFDGILSAIKFNLKTPLKSFSGRTGELQKLHQALQNKDCKAMDVISPTVLICGLGGIGKSVLVRQYANQFSDNYDGNIIWIDAETHITLTDSFHMLCKDYLNIPTQNDDQQQIEISAIVQKVYSFLRYRKCLFIFDNALEFKSDGNGIDGIMWFLPKIQVINTHFIITSRKQNWHCDINIKLDVFKDAEAEQLVKSSLKIHDDQHINNVKALLQQLGNFPLALQQAIAHIRQINKKSQKASGKTFTISDYLKMYTLQSKDLLDFDFPSDCNETYTKSTFMTWNSTLAEIEKAILGKEAREIVNIMAYLNPDVSTKFFAELLGNSEEKLNQAFNLIEGYSMITLHDGNAKIHRLVQSVTRNKLHGTQQQVILKKTLGLIQNHTDNNLIIHGASVWNYAILDHNLVKEFHTVPAKIIAALNATVRYEECIVFGKASLNTLKRVIGANHLSTLNTQKKVAKTLYHQGKYEDALWSYRQVLQKAINILGTYNLLTLTTKQNIAHTLSNQGKYEEALSCYREVLQKKIQIFGPEHQSTLSTKHAVAQTLSKQGKYEEALCSYRKILEKQINILGPEHPHTLNTKHNLAQTLSNQGKYEEALDCYKEVHKNQIKILGPENPSTLSTQHNVAHTLYNQGKYEEAQCSYKQVLQRKIKILGPEHPSTLDTIHNIAKIISKQGKYEEALSCYREVLEKQVKILGPEYPSTLTTQHNVANTMSKQGKYEEALSCYREVLEKQIKILGPDNPLTLITQHNIAETLSKQYKYEEALCVYREVLEIQIKVLGPEHPSTLTTQQNVANTLSKQGKYAEALCSFKDVLKKRIRILGPENLTTLITQHNFAEALYYHGKYEEALDCYTDVLHKRIKILGPNSRATASIQHNIAKTLSNQGKYEEALCSFSEVLEKQIKILGPEHPSTLITRHNIVQTLSKQGKYEDALCSYREVLEKQIKILGIEHPSILITKNNIANTLSKQGKYEEALCSYTEVFQKQIIILGIDHPSTLITAHNVAQTLSNQGNYVVAQCYYNEVLERKIKILGTQHPSTLITEHNVAQTLSKQGKYEEAQCCYREVLEKQIRVFGPEHPSTLTTKHNVANTLSLQGKYEEALCMYNEVLEKKIEVLGPHNQSTITTQCNVAQMLTNLGKYAEALRVYKDLHEKQVNMLGPDNPSTLCTQRRIEHILSWQGKKNEECLII